MDSSTCRSARQPLPTKWSDELTGPTLQVHARKSNMLLWLALDSAEDV
jgi:hypothetical protein